jgi:hypothetical protein
VVGSNRQLDVSVRKILQVTLIDKNKFFSQIEVLEFLNVK